VGVYETVPDALKTMSLPAGGQAYNVSLTNNGSVTCLPMIMGLQNAAPGWEVSTSYGEANITSSVFSSAGFAVTTFLAPGQSVTFQLSMNPTGATNGTYPSAALWAYWNPQDPTGARDSVAVGDVVVTTPTLTPTATNTPIPSVYRINCEGNAYVDSQGNTWAADQYYNGGASLSTTNTIAGTADPTLYQTMRYGNPFTYTFPVPAGSYQITLKFAEIFVDVKTKGTRVFNVSINGVQVLTNFDIFADVGGAYIADDKVFNNITMPTSGAITIQFGPASAYVAGVNAIQIIPQLPMATPTNTATKTDTNTATSTATASLTHTATEVATDTMTSTATKTDTATATYTATSTMTNTTTNTSTKTDTATVTYTPTNTVTNTTTNTAMNTVTNTATETVTNTMTHTPTNTVTQTATNMPTVTNTLTLTYTITNTPVFTLADTATNTPTLTMTITPTNSMTPVASSTAYGTATSTLTNPPTSPLANIPTVTQTNTPTFSSVANIEPPYPNPSRGTPISFMVQAPSSSTVTMDVFTLAFRRIDSQTVQVNGSQVILWNLTDASGAQAANGLYYVRIRVSGAQSVEKTLKVLVLR
jgi:hypothetical protein